MSRTVWAAFSAVARVRPGRPAILHDDGTVTAYGELRVGVEKLSAQLTGVAAGGAVAVLTNDPCVLLWGALAANAAGCAFVPIGENYPRGRREQILADVGAEALIADEEGRPVVRALAGAGAAGQLDDAAYVLFTSGSTGKPKGVIISNGALIDRLDGLASWPGLGEDDTILALTHPTFDIALAETLLPLTVGAGVVVSRWRSPYDLKAVGKVLAQRSPTVVQATPSWWRLALSRGSLPRVDRIWCGGEAMSEVLARGLQSASRQVWNVYGPTEATIWSSASAVTDPRAVRLGRPVPGVRYEIGGPGAEPDELVIHGSGLADGYLNQPDETARRFGKDADGRSQAYRTGDRVRAHPDGSIEFLGRLDRQVKVRGNRIELSEVESCLEGHPQVMECAVEAVPDREGESLSLAAFVVCPGGPDAVELRRWLRARLPDGYVPARILFLASLPRTTAGKVDRVGLVAGLDAAT